MTEPGSKRLIRMGTSFYQSCVLQTACALGLFDAIEAHGSLETRAVAKTLDLDEDATRKLLDACVALELLSKEDSGSYRNTEDTSAFLVTASASRLTDAMEWYRMYLYPAWGRLEEYVRTGEPVVDPNAHYGSDPQRTDTFIRAMHNRSTTIGAPIIEKLDMKGAAHLLDVGGGSGAYAMCLANKNPELSCTIVDSPEVCRIADELVAAAGLADRVKTLPGNYHEIEFPACDAVHLFGVLHLESESAIQTILSRAKSALRSGGTIRVLDMMTDGTRSKPAYSALFSLKMSLISADGWVFSDDDLRDWLAASGFTGIEITPLPPLPHWLATATKP